MAAPTIVPLQCEPSETRVVNDDIRHFIWDRTIADNPLEMDLEFDDTEIGYARKHAIEMFNALPPYVVSLKGNHVPADWQYPLKLGIVYHLFLGKLISLQRKDLDYSAGNMTVDINKRRIEYLTKWVPFFKQEAETLIKQQKVIFNLESCYLSL